MNKTGESGIETLLSALRATRDSGHERAMAMPPAFYTDPELFALECDRLFRGQWHCIARVDELRKAGDFVALDLVGEPIVAIRGSDGMLRVLSNVCRHRGTVLLEGKGQARTIVCPYHAWSYGTDGTLKRAPLMQGAELFDPASCRLPEIRSEVWNGFLYANLDDDAAPLAPGLTGLGALAENFAMDGMTTVHIEETR